MQGIIGWKMKDNDPRMAKRILTIDSAVRGPFGVTHYMAKDQRGRLFKIQASRIYGDAKARRTGFSLVRPDDTV